MTKASNALYLPSYHFAILLLIISSYIVLFISNQQFFKTIKIISQKKMPEITEEKDDEDVPCTTSTADQKERIRQIIRYQKANYLSSSSSSSAASASSSFSCASSSKSSSLLDLMKEGSTSLRRLFDMEHISLASHFKDYSASPVIKPILLWGSDTDDDVRDGGGIQRSISWKTIKQMGHESYPVSDGSFVEKESSFSNLRTRKNRRRMIRTTSYKKLPGINLWRFRGFRFRFRLRRLRIMICGKML